MVEIRERIARALWERECEMPRVAFIERPWDEVTDQIREAMLAYADAVLEALAPELALIKQARWERQQDVGF